MDAKDKDILPAKLFLDEQTTNPLCTVNLRFTRATKLRSIRNHVDKIFTRTLLEKRPPNQVVQLSFHRRRPDLMQRDVNNNGFEAYSYVRGEIIDPELHDADTITEVIGTAVDGVRVARGTISAFLTSPDWLARRLGSHKPKNNFWGKKQLELEVHLPVFLARLCMQYTSPGISYFRTRDIEIEEKLSARELRDKEIKSEFNNIISSGGDLKRFFDERYSDEAQNDNPVLRTHASTSTLSLPKPDDLMQQDEMD